jgi:hypothetical protein
VPERWVVDLGSTGAKAKTLFRPQTYFRIPTEDRLWIPEEYVPLFVEKETHSQEGARVGDRGEGTNGVVRG